jgi:hypothetical protein
VTPYQSHLTKNTLCKRPRNYPSQQPLYRSHVHCLWCVGIVLSSKHNLFGARLDGWTAESRHEHLVKSTLPTFDRRNAAPADSARRFRLCTPSATRRLYTPLSAASSPPASGPLPGCVSLM